jgi:hypothetical protein
VDTGGRWDAAGSSASPLLAKIYLHYVSDLWVPGVARGASLQDSSQPGAPEYLPAYAPELNPLENLWGYWKHHELPTSVRMTSVSPAITRDTHCDRCVVHP